MKITIIYDNTAFKKDLQSDWGFSFLVWWRKKLYPQKSIEGWTGEIIEI